MAANTHLFGDKETNNWLKACIGLNVTKEGLANFLCAELQKVHTIVGRSCGNCPIENLIQCPTNPYCNKRKRNYCPFHKSQKPQPCPICDNVKHNIILHHRYGGPSWRNTRAEKWALNYWEIGKCYLPPDGYSSISSVQESDFNGVISIMLNCLHFQTCLSPLCLSPPPPDKQCPLEKVRQIGRDVRHTSDCKVTDADLQDYFKTLSTLLADPQYLQHDPSAIIACTRLSDLQNDRMSFEELGKLLKEVNQTLEKAKKTGERFSEIAKRTLSKHLQKLDATNQLGLIRLKKKTTVGEQRLHSKTKFGEHRLERKTQFGAQRIESSVQHGIERMQQAANKTAQADYERDVADFRRRLVEHYNDTSSNVPLSVLDQSLDKRITDIYATPKMHRFDIASDGKRVKKDIVLTYKELFYTDDTKSNRRVYVQGEPGSGKSTFAAKLVHDWCDENRPSTAAPNKNASFDDVLIIQNFQFIFFLSLGESRGQTEVTHMIKQQIIDTMYSDEKRDVMYTLLLRIIETEICLVICDGLDEWVAPDGSNLAEPSMAGFPKDKCAVLTTSRPWKLADERIKNSRIDILVEIEGISDSATFSERVLRCILDKSKDLETTAWEIRCFIVKRGLESLSNSPMLYTLVICTWVDTMEEEEHLNGSSLCALYTTFLESLCKKANDTTGFFNDLNPPHVKCFSRTSYLRPIIQNVDVISKAAFHLLFSPEKEKSIVFNDQELSNYLTPSEQEFALKAGLISKRKTKRALNSSISFIHKSMQEFLAAYHIAHNAHLIDDVISGYLGRYSDAYLDISQVFIFLCGLNIPAANKLSGIMNEQSCIMNEHNNINMIDIKKISYEYDTFQSIIEAGYTEAVSNDQTGILLRLSHFDIDGDNLMVMNNIWRENKSNALALKIHVDDETDHAIHSSSTHSEPTSQVEFDLSSCLYLKDLVLSGSGIHLQDSSSSVSSTLPVCIVLNSANPAKCADPPPLLPCIEWIELEYITCSSTWLRSLFSTLLTLEQNAVCELTEVSCQGTFIDSATLLCLKKTLAYNSDSYLQECNVLWEVLHGLNIKSLSLDTSVINCADMMSQSLSSLTHLDTLSIRGEFDDSGPWQGLHGLNIKSLSLSGQDGGLNVKYADSISQSLLSLTHLDTLSIEVGFDDSGLWQALRGLNIISLSLSGLYGGFSVDYADSMSQSLSSLTHLDTLSIEVEDDSLFLSDTWVYNCADRTSHLETLSIRGFFDDSGLWQALHGLNIKSLSLRGRYEKLNVNYAGSMSQSLLSLTHLDTLSIEVYVNSPGLWKALHGLNIKSLSLSAWRGYLKEHNADSMSQSLLSLTHLDTLSIEVNDDSPGLWKALHGLNIKSLILSDGYYNVKHAETQAQSLSSLKQLEKLSIFLRTYIDIKLPQSLKYLNIYCVTLLPSELHELVGTLSACTRTVESKLEFGCASFNDFRVKSIPPEEYISIQQELGTLNHVAVKRFRILHRICEYDAASPWSVRGIGGVQDDNTDDDNVNDVAYKRFVTATADPTYLGIINRIAMRLLITPSSNS
ncbi:hypothetical protein DPMN_070404 [Dreissena polymorpha]|uniref:NACHT domain-containing protein n=1 Tax=Dreissena polymorpha TaxID=45954 RepID=A0A9D3Z512_DREPO|nr:hypothetical protein DPMN_070404 [Dreissena polymorpha]